MKEILLNILILLYLITGIISTIAYWPTIKDLSKKKKSANSLSYFLWTLTGAITFLYSLFVLNDLLFRIISGLSFFSCFLILILSLRIRHTD